MASPYAAARFSATVGTIASAEPRGLTPAKPDGHWTPPRSLPDVELLVPTFLYERAGAIGRVN